MGYKVNLLSLCMHTLSQLRNAYEKNLPPFYFLSPLRQSVVAMCALTTARTMWQRMSGTM
jgi:hypothetical protein